MLHSIGYQNMKSINMLIAILFNHDISHLVDVRSRPYGRKTIFNRSRLEPALIVAGLHYQWCGDRLGGFKNITDDAISKLAKWQLDKRACLLCLESDPDKCHRKYEIGRRLQEHDIKVTHL